MKEYGYVGLLIIIAAEALLFSGNQFVGRWFTPIVWTGYICFADALVLKATKRSLLTTDRVELLIIAVVSIGSWWLFEFYNSPRFWLDERELWWHYHSLELNPYLRRVGYDWAFATIFPAMFLTARFLLATLFKTRPSFRPLKLSRTVLFLMIALGAVGTLLPFLVVSAWHAPVVWLSLVFLIDPINYLRGWPSITGDLSAGNYQRLFALLLAGEICGVLWEFWNYWAISRWTYTVPFLGDLKIFEMPVLGYLGYPPFTVECWAIFIFIRSLLTTAPRHTETIWFESNL